MRKQRLIRSRRRGLAALGPTHAAPHGVGHHLAIVGQRHDVVEHHRHVAAELLLNGDGPLGRQLDRAHRRCASEIARRCSSTVIRSARLKT